MKRRYTLKEIEHKSNIVQTLFTIYIVCMVLLIATGVGDFGINIGGRKMSNIGNGFYYFMLAVGGILTAIFYGIYLHLMDKWNIIIKCPYCNKSMDTHKISISPADGFLGTQTCQKCGEKFTPTFKDAE
ncbi:MAG: hypothetical protein E7432_00150 [Ruminococcaceae bacterium]|nr:hypothetical protein [Oscillospiraceae bacterium]